jgi:hypothetical protein
MNNDRILFSHMNNDRILFREEYLLSEVCPVVRMIIIRAKTKSPEHSGSQRKFFTISGIYSDGGRRT